MLFCQDFNEQLEGYTQLSVSRWAMYCVVLLGFQ